MYKIKQRPEDFIVEEIIELDSKPGPYFYIKLTKKQWNTLDVVKILQERLHLKRSQIGYAGLKDKQGITTQYFSLFRVKKEKIYSLKIKDITIETLHYGSKPIVLGALKANKFKIKLNEKPIKISFIENYFGKQRFSKNNIEIGRALINHDFKKAITLINNHESNSPINELRKIDKHLLLLYISAYQSYLWNLVVSDYLKKQDSISYNNLTFLEKEPENMQIPIISFDIEFKNKEIEKIYNKFLKIEKITKENFIIKSLPELISLSKERELIVKTNDFKIRKNVIEFTISKGSYATVVIEKMNALTHTKNI